MILIIISFFAGILSVLAPCVLPVVPVIFSWTLSWRGNSQTRRVMVSMMVSIVLFTFLLKASTLFINVSPSFWTSVSVIIIIWYGLTLVFPIIWEKISMLLHLDRANQLAEVAGDKQGFWGDILLGASLGPIFASCSPTYALLLSTVLPVNLSLWLISMIVYALGFGWFLYVLVKGWKSVIRKFYGVSDSNSRLKRILGIILIITWVLIATGAMEKIQVAFTTYAPDIGQVEQYIIKKTKVMPWTGEDGLLRRDLSNSQTPRNHVEPGASSQEIESLLNANYPAPPLVGLTWWINSSGLSLADLKWKVVIIDFWTYSCINCIRTLPHIQSWYEKYKNDGLVIIWVHAPEFAFERVYYNVLKASKEFGLTYPIAQDNDYTTWRNFNNHYRPAKYIIDKEGKVRYQHFGEGAYEETEQVIKYLLDIKNGLPRPESELIPVGTRNDVNPGGLQWKLEKFQAGVGQITPETYLGTARRWDSVLGWLIWKLNGNRKDEEERVSLESWTWSLDITFQARTINLVLDSEDEKRVQVVVKEWDQIINSFKVTSSKLYNIATYPRNGVHSISIEFKSAGVNAYAFTFG